MKKFTTLTMATALVFSMGLMTACGAEAPVNEEVNAEVVLDEAEVPATDAVEEEVAEDVSAEDVSAEDVMEDVSAEDVSADDVMEDVSAEDISAADAE